MVANFGRLDAAFNNAWIQISASEIADQSAEDCDYISAINQRGVWACMKHEIAQVRKQGSGAIVNCSSIGGLTGRALIAAYHGTKHGVIGLTRHYRHADGIDDAGQGDAGDGRRSCVTCR
ncbi:Rossmann-fold NAD(P)-binding domain-containing protein [Azotobacter armeniacus]